MKHFATVLLTLTLFGCAMSQWVNDLDGTLDFNCPFGETISRVQSIHDNDSEDRLWAFECKPIPIDSSDLTCQNSGYVNDFDEEITFNCPFNGVISGTHSEHSNHDEDRRWDFKCCEALNYCTTNCYFTPEVNDYDGPMDYTVDTDYYISGVASHHDNGKEDRRWRFFVCKVITCGAN
ncbi:unnamed protein product [Notodromas monacha]|nr:unnamed protein product [Notodromas monacha]CAG0914388.1 unnamed protein product [Notodromas monacha]